MKYDNRLSTGMCCNKPKPEREITTPIIPETKPEPVPEIKPEIVITGSKCWTVKVKHITKVKDKVLIMFDDCSFIEADEDVLDINLCKLANTETAEKVNKIYNRLDNLIQVEDSTGKAIKDGLPLESST